MDLNEIITQVVLMVVGTFLPIVGIWVGFMVRKRIASLNRMNDLLAKEEWVDAGVKFAEVTYGALSGPQQYEIALEWISNRFHENGLKVNEPEIRGLVDKFVMKMKEGWYSYYYEEPGPTPQERFDEFDSIL